MFILKRKQLKSLRISIVLVLVANEHLMRFIFIKTEFVKDIREESDLVHDPYFSQCPVVTLYKYIIPCRYILKIEVNGLRDLFIGVIQAESKPEIGTEIIIEPLRVEMTLVELLYSCCNTRRKIYRRIIPSSGRCEFEIYRECVLSCTSHFSILCRPAY